MKKRLITLITAFLFSAAVHADSTAGGKIPVNKNSNGLALQGHDPVAYFTDHKPEKGSAKFKSNYESANYYFATADHRTLYLAAQTSIYRIRLKIPGAQAFVKN